jgi:hypothetical protein
MILQAATSRVPRISQAAQNYRSFTFLIQLNVKGGYLVFFREVPGELK